MNRTTHLDNNSIAGAMLLQMADQLPFHTQKGVPAAALFEQGVSIFRPEIGEFAGSAARDKWARTLASIEEWQIGPVRGWLRNLLGTQADHPLLQQSIDWIEARGEETGTAVRLLLADLYMEIGDADKAQQAYAAALRAHSEKSPYIPIME